MTPSNTPRSRPSKGFKAGIKWWWNTRIRSLWTVRLPAYRQRKRIPEKSLQFEVSASELRSYPDEDAYTAILTVYKRAEFLNSQIEALRQQTKPPAEIWVWTNDSDEVPADVSKLADRVIISNTNWKFWGRFAIANLARTDYICILDDDTLPERRWIENCINTYKTGIDGILGGSGVILPEAGGYSSRHKVGWNGHHYDHATIVDLVGHAWFFRKKYLSFLWMEQPHSWENGEDIHFSYMAQKYGNLNTWVPPHPESDPALWSCRPEFGKVAGRKNVATHKTGSHHNIRGEMVDTYRANGWQLVCEARVS